MGWMRHWEQQQVLLLYGKQAEFRCNYCKQPIYINELHVENPKKGYHPKEEGAPSFLPKKPKWTVHLHPCNDILTGKHPVYADERGHVVVVDVKKKVKKAGEVESPNGKSDKRILHIAERILVAMKKKPDGEWNVRRCIRTLKKDFRKPLIRLAVRHLKATDQVNKKGRYLYLPKKKKEKK